MMGTKYVIPSPDSIVIPGWENTQASCQVQGIAYQLSSLLEDMAEEQITRWENKGSEEKTFFPCRRVC